MLVEVALEVEVGQLLALRHAEELLERRIRLDVVLVLQALLLHVVVHRLGDLGARHLRALGLAKERAQLLRDLGRALEDRGRTLDLHTVLIELGLALALASILDLAVHTLLHTLDLAEQGGHGLAHRGQVASHRLDVLIKSGGRRSHGRGLGGGRRDRRDHDGRSHNRRRRISLRGLGGLLRRGGRRGDHGGGRRYNYDLRDNFLLRDLLSDLGGSRSVHYTGIRGILHEIFPHYLLPGDLCASIFGQHR